MDLKQHNVELCKCNMIFCWTDRFPSCCSFLGNFKNFEAHKFQCMDPNKLENICEMILVYIQDRFQIPNILFIYFKFVSFKNDFLK